MNPESDKPTERAQSTPLPYEPPRIESVLTKEELAREVLYAGHGHTPHGT